MPRADCSAETCAGSRGQKPALSPGSGNRRSQRILVAIPVAHSVPGERSAPRGRPSVLRKISTSDSRSSASSSSAMPKCDKISSSIFRNSVEPIGLHLVNIQPRFEVERQLERTRHAFVFAQVAADELDIGADRRASISESSSLPQQVVDLFSAEIRTATRNIPDMQPAFALLATSRNIAVIGMALRVP